MKTKFLFKLTGATLLALGMSAGPVASGFAIAQDAEPGAGTPTPPAAASPTVQDREAVLEEAGEEAIQGVEAAGQAAQQNVQEAVESLQTAQQTTQEAQRTAVEAAEAATAAAERAEMAAQMAAENNQEGIDWGWLGLLGLIGLFGLLRGNRRRVVETNDRHRYPATPTATTSTTDYRSPDDYR